MKTHTLGADQFVEFILTRERIKIQNDGVNYGNDLKYEDMISSFKLFPQFTSSFSISPLVLPSINIGGGVYRLGSYVIRVVLVSRTGSVVNGLS